MSENKVYHNPYKARIMNGEKELDVLKEAAIIYILSDGWTDCEKKTGVNKHTFRNFIISRITLLETEAPDLFFLLKGKLGKTVVERDLEVGKVKPLNSEVFKSLPRVIKYNDFLNIMCKYSTAKSGYELIKIANKYGVDVIG